MVARKSQPEVNDLIVDAMIADVVDTSVCVDSGSDVNMFR